MKIQDKCVFIEMFINELRIVQLSCVLPSFEFFLLHFLKDSARKTKFWHILCVLIISSLNALKKRSSGSLLSYRVMNFV